MNKTLNLKKTIFFILISGILTVISFNYAIAKVPEISAEPLPLPEKGIPKGANIIEIKEILAIITDILEVIYVVFFIAAAGCMILAAFSYLTAQGNPEKIKNATKQITWGAIAIAVALILVGVNVIVYNFVKQ